MMAMVGLVKVVAPCQIARMITYDITGTASNGFQVSVTGSSGTNVIGAFSTLQEAEVFADKMRSIDADHRHGARAVMPDGQNPAVRRDT
jgi:hypothetical protein